MADVEWIENIRQIAMKAVESGEPCDIMLGTVVTPAPLSVQLDQKTTLTGPQLLVPQALTNHTVEMSIPGVGTVSVAVKNALKAGEAVLMIQKRGGQQYLIVGRY